MKAWLVREKDEFCAEVIFAETRGKARALAKYTDACEDVDFINIEVHRQPQCDKYYKEGKFGIRIEDTLVIKGGKAVSLMKTNKALTYIENGVVKKAKI